MATTTLTATKADAQHRIVAMFCKHLTTLDEMRDKAREYQAQFATNPDAQVPMMPQVEATGFIEVYSPATVIEMTISSIEVIEMTISSIEDTTRQIELEMARTEAVILNSHDAKEVETHEAYANTRVAETYEWEISILNKPLEAFNESLQAGITAYWQATREWLTRLNA